MGTHKSIHYLVLNPENVINTQNKHCLVLNPDDVLNEYTGVKYQKPRQAVQTKYMTSTTQQHYRKISKVCALSTTINNPQKKKTGTQQHFISHKKYTS